MPTGCGPLLLCSASSSDSMTTTTSLLPSATVDSDGDVLKRLFGVPTAAAVVAFKRRGVAVAILVTLGGSAGGSSSSSSVSTAVGRATERRVERPAVCTWLDATEPSSDVWLVRRVVRRAGVVVVVVGSMAPELRRVERRAGESVVVVVRAFTFSTVSDELRRARVRRTLPGGCCDDDIEQLSSTEMASSGWRESPPGERCSLMEPSLGSADLDLGGVVSSWSTELRRLRSERVTGEMGKIRT